jgi:hypothetical protein
MNYGKSSWILRILDPFKMLGAAYNGQGQNEYTIGNNEGSAIYQGDPVILSQMVLLMSVQLLVLNLLVFLMVANTLIQLQESLLGVITTQEA